MRWQVSALRGYPAQRSDASPSMTAGTVRSDNLQFCPPCSDLACRRGKRWPASQVWGQRVQARRLASDPDDGKMTMMIVSSCVWSCSAEYNDALGRLLRSAVSDQFSKVQTCCNRFCIQSERIHIRKVRLETIKDEPNVGGLLKRNLNLNIRENWLKNNSRLIPRRIYLELFIAHSFRMNAAYLIRPIVCASLTISARTINFRPRHSFRKLKTPSINNSYVSETRAHRPRRGALPTARYLWRNNGARYSLAVDSHTAAVGDVRARFNGTPVKWNRKSTPRNRESFLTP